MRARGVALVRTSGTALRRSERVGGSAVVYAARVGAPTGKETY